MSNKRKLNIVIIPDYDEETLAYKRQKAEADAEELKMMERELDELLSTDIDSLIEQYNKDEAEKKRIEDEYNNQLLTPESDNKIYFFKLSDGFDKNVNKEWLKYVNWAIVMLSDVCNKHSVDNKNKMAILFANLENLPIYTKHTFEKYTTVNVTRDRIISGSIFEFSDTDIIINKKTRDVKLCHSAIDRLSKILYEFKKNNKNILNDVYIHFTCNNFIDNINKMGLVLNPPLLVGDYEVEEDNNNGEEKNTIGTKTQSKKSSPNKANKTKSKKNSPNKINKTQSKKSSPNESNKTKSIDSKK
jgi:hypothetical protein